MQQAFTYRKTKTGEWVAYGPASIIDEVNPGGDINILKRDGTIKTETVSRYGRTFNVKGQEMVYAYLDRNNSYRRSYAPRVTRGFIACHGCGEEHPRGTKSCWECGAQL